MVIDSFKGDYNFLSNFYYVPILYNGKWYRSTEHAFQAAKTISEADHEAVRNAATPALAKKLARSLPKRDDWDDIRIDVMLELTRRKFAKAELATKLIATGDAELIEGNYWNDTFWGVCRGKGENHLGKVLMQVREEISGV